MSLESTKVQESRVGDRFADFVSQHRIWKNPLLIACMENELALSDYGFIISQHFYYSRGFTRLLSALMVSCDNDKYRAELSHNLWEEAGEEDLENRHSNLLRKMLSRVFGIDNPDETKFNDYTTNYFDNCLKYLISNDAISSASFMGWGTEGIVERLYSIFFDGLVNLGVPEEELTYLSLHMECDDEHAEIIENIALDQCGPKLEYHADKIEQAIDKALSLRDSYFLAIYNDLNTMKLSGLVKSIKQPKLDIELPATLNHHASLTQAEGVKLYSSDQQDEGIKFHVSRFDLGCEVMDPRLLEIAVGSRNEVHRHAHESIFYIVSGQGNIHIGDKSIEAKKGDIVYVPRWVSHYSENIGEEALCIFAITDFGLTNHFPKNTNNSYRKNKNM
ncbi:iron-containing redox enzyme family protein [Agarilytica rhodophyticola]|uniref:iron-containing redox enzyme family protein n=1 Tax=Agarilytica rhodophyticola TaxID=1737490 RepID=UPI000B348E88|nr:iron-containing redox enzyme family protein [Agarilytica rhodophyticola]